jgi:hypothetical protein
VKKSAQLAQLLGSSQRPWMKTTGVLPEALAARISWFSRSEIEVIGSSKGVRRGIARRCGVLLANGTTVALTCEDRIRENP